MMIKPIFILGAALLLGSSAEPPRPAVDQVDPFIGTGFHGHTYPGATAPFGGVQLSPDTRRGNWDACAGYHYSDSTLMGFSHTHLSGTGCIDLGDILFRPFPGETTRFSHADEKASPGYYAVDLPDAGVKAELTATPHTGIHRYTWRKGTAAELTVDLGHLLDNETILADTLRQNAPDEISGMRCTTGWVPNQYVYFVARFSAPIRTMKKVGDRAARLTFDLAGEEPLIAKVGLSIVGEANARLNLETETGDSFAFDSLALVTRKAWEKELACITIEGGSQEEQTSFYTALYHSKVVPNVVSDVNGEYRRHDMQTGLVPAGHRQFSTFSTWDTFRAWHPMMTLLDTTLVNDMIGSLLAMYDASGELPLWPLSAGETGTMIGYHSASIIADAYLKGFRGFDARHALEAMKVSAAKNKKGAAEYIAQGFIPADRKKESVSCLLEFAYDDWCIARMAEAMGKTADYATFIARSQNFVHVFDGNTQFFRGKRQDGNWESPFNPFEIGRSYTEATAWQYRFFTPHDVYGLEQLMGGRDRFIANLDSLFAASSETEGDLVDVTGLIGQYAHGNEPSHHMAYLYSYVGQPWKTQYWTRRLLKEMYPSTPEGIVGNEDCGQMSAWYILSSLGFYPVCPGSNQFVLTSPLFEKATIRLGNGKTLTMTANAPERNTYISAVTLNGTPIETCYLTYEQLMAGGTLAFTLSSEPNRTWGTASENAPYSYTTRPTVSIPFVTNDLYLFEGETTADLQCTTQGAEIHYTLDGEEPTQQSPLYRQPIRLTKATWIKAKAYKDGYEPSRTFVIRSTPAVLRPSLPLSDTQKASMQPGVSYAYYEGYFHKVADLDTLQPHATGRMPQPDIAGAAQDDHFGYIFQGAIEIPEDGIYTFFTRSDDGSVLYISGEEVVNNDGSHAAISATGRIPLQKGLHPFTLKYFEDYEGEHLSWGWKKPGDTEFSPIPARYLVAPAPEKP